MAKLDKLSIEEMENVIYDARCGDLETIRAIFDQEVDSKIIPTIKDPNSQCTMIHMAAANGHLDVIKFLISELNEKADNIAEFLNSVNENGNTALHWAAFNGHLDTVKFLCENGSDPFLKNEYNHDVFYEAGNNQKEEVEDYLLEKYAMELEEEMEERDTNNLEGESPSEEDSGAVEFNEGSEIAKIGEADAIAVEKLRKEADNLQVGN